MSTLNRATIEAQIVKKSLKDSAFRQSLIANPKAAIEKSYGITLPADVKINVYEETADIFNIVLPATGSTGADLSGLTGSVAMGWGSAAECFAECTQCGNNDTTCQPGPTEE